MIWDFQDGIEYESSYRVDGYDCDSVEKVAKMIAEEFPESRIIPRDPVADYERMHREAASILVGTDRARSAFLKSALNRVKRLGRGVLIETRQNENTFRIVVTQPSLSILRVRGCEIPELEESFAKRIANRLGGVTRKLVY